MQVEEQIIQAQVPPENGRANGHKQHNLQLLLASLQTGSQRLREGAAIAFTSASHGEGVTHVTQLFAVEMARYTGRRTLVIDAERLQSLGVEDYLQMPWNCHPTNIENLWMLPAKKKRKHTDETQAQPQRSGVGSLRVSVWMMRRDEYKTVARRLQETLAPA